MYISATCEVSGGIARRFATTPITVRQGRFRPHVMQAPMGLRWDHQASASRWLTTIWPFRQSRPGLPETTCRPVTEKKFLDTALRVTDSSERAAVTESTPAPGSQVLSGIKSWKRPLAVIATSFTPSTRRRSSWSRCSTIWTCSPPNSQPAWPGRSGARGRRESRTLPRHISVWCVVGHDGEHAGKTLAARAKRPDQDTSPPSAPAPAGRRAKEAVRRRPDQMLTSNNLK